VVVGNDGLLRIIRIEFKNYWEIYFSEILASDMRDDPSVAIDERVPVLSAVKIGFCKNWTLQPDLLTGIPPEHKEFFSEEYISTTATDLDTEINYKLSDQPVQKDTLLLREFDAVTEAQRLLDIFKQHRTVYVIDGYLSLLGVQLGDHVKVVYGRFGLSDGSVGNNGIGVVVKKQINWIDFSIKLGVII